MSLKGSPPCQIKFLSPGMVRRERLKANSPSLTITATGSLPPRSKYSNSPIGLYFLFDTTFSPNFATSFFRSCSRIEPDTDSACPYLLGSTAISLANCSDKRTNRAAKMARMDGETGIPCRILAKPAANTAILGQHSLDRGGGARSLFRCWAGPVFPRSGRN